MHLRLMADSLNKVIIHCQSNMGRSGYVISSLLCIMKYFNHPMEALTHFCKVIE